MRFSWKAIITVFVVMIAVSSALAEGKMRTMTLDASNAMLLQEFGAVVQIENDTLVVTMVMPAEKRAAAYRDVDIMEGDRLLMCNGKRVRGVGDLRSAIDSLEAGAMIKLGLHREGRLSLARYKKADPEDLPGRMMMMKQETGPGGAVQKSISFSSDGSDAQTVMVLDGGLVVGPGENGPVVMALLPNAAETLSGDMPQEGDRIVSINGEVDSNMKAFQELYDGIPDGEKITVEFERDGKRHTATYVKSPLKTGGAVRIKQ